MRGKTLGKGSEKAPDVNAKNNLENSRLDTLHESEDKDGEFKKGGRIKRKHGGKVEGKKAKERADKKKRHGRFAKGGAVDGRSPEAMAKGSDKMATESEARRVKMRGGWKPEINPDKEDD